MAKKETNGANGLFESAISAFELSIRAKQIQCEYTLKARINALADFVNGAKLAANP
ncbi:TPA: hypothetical protein IAD52_01575 [Candidatus Spyradomonas excrementavium]|nr:hypothetical protein [Candidatus Spyradomonas excrementavium]